MSRHWRICLAECLQWSLQCSCGVLQVRKQQADRLSRVHRYAASLQAEKGELQLQAARAQQALANSAQHAQQGGAGLIKAHHSSSEKVNILAIHSC